jgi:hypothetical protein
MSFRDTRVPGADKFPGHASSGDANFRGGGISLPFQKQANVALRTKMTFS